jgi:N-formylglutamate deformylase
MRPYRFQKAYSPVFVCNTHGGTLISPDISQSMTEAGLQADANRLLIRLFDVQVLERAAAITSNISRHVIDLDRSEESSAVTPLKNAAGANIYQSGSEPTELEIDNRINSFFRPFHAQISHELDRIVRRYGKAVLIDIRATDSAEKPAISVSVSADTVPAKLQKLATDWQLAIKERHETSVDANEDEASEIVQRYAKLEDVTVFQIFLNESNFVDPDDGDFDFETGRELTKSIESLIRVIMHWAESS